MAKEKSTKKELTELLEDLYIEIRAVATEAEKRIETSYPNLVFQEKHTSGWLWWKRTWYQYTRYSEGSMIGLKSIGYSTIISFEEGK